MCKRFIFGLEEILWQLVIVPLKERAFHSMNLPIEFLSSLSLLWQGLSFKSI
jgi:hypothetical protein